MEELEAQAQAKESPDVSDLNDDCAVATSNAAPLANGVH